MKKQLNDLYTIRKKKYEEASNFTIETSDNDTLSEVSNKISSIFIKYNNEKIKIKSLSKNYTIFIGLKNLDPLIKFLEENNFKKIMLVF